MFGRGLADGGGGDSAGRQPLPDSDDSLLHHHKRRDGEAALQGSPPVSATQQRDHLDASQAKQLPLHAPPSYARFPEPASKPPPSQSQSQSQHAIPFASGGLAPALPPIKSLADHNSDDGLRHTTTLPSFAALAASATSSSSQAPLARSPPAGTAANTTTESSSYAPPQQRPPIAHWPSLNPFTAYYAPSYVQSAAPAAADSPSSSNKIDIEMNGAAGGGAPAPNPASPDRFLDGRSSSVSLDDPDVRLAAEALGDLKAGMCISCPRAIADA